MRALEEQVPSPELDFISGLVPEYVEAADEHQRHIEYRHR
jgi:hypothetical protein